MREYVGGIMKEIGVNMYCMDVCEHTFEEITIISTLISTIQELCLNLELNSQYYEDAENLTQKLSEERNKYINLSAMALQHLKTIELLNTELETQLT